MNFDDILRQATNPPEHPRHRQWVAAIKEANIIVDESIGLGGDFQIRMALIYTIVQDLMRPELLMMPLTKSIPGEGQERNEP